MSEPDGGCGITDGPFVVAGRTVTLTNVDRVLWPETGTTKAAMLAWYRAIAPVLVPYLRGRVLTLGRFPSGVHERGWYQTNCRGAPPWMRTHEVVGKRGDRFRMCVVDDEPSLVWVVNQGTVELHPFLWSTDRPAEPDVVVLDLDPGPPAGLAECARVALRLAERLALAGIRAVAKTSGAFGLHLAAGLAPGHDFVATKRFARELAATLAAETPQSVVDVQRRASRAGKVLVDWLQNDAGRSTVAPYSLRATPWPLVSTPLTWDEVEGLATGRRPDGFAGMGFSPGAVLDRVERSGDLFAAALHRDSRLPIGDPRPR